MITTIHSIAGHRPPADAAAWHALACGVPAAARKNQGRLYADRSGWGGVGWGVPLAELSHDLSTSEAFSCRPAHPAVVQERRKFKSPWRALLSGGDVYAQNVGRNSFLRYLSPQAPFSSCLAWCSWPRACSGLRAGIWCRADTQRVSEELGDWFAAPRSWNHLRSHGMEVRNEQEDRSYYMEPSQARQHRPAAGFRFAISLRRRPGLTVGPWLRAGRLRKTTMERTLEVKICFATLNHRNTGI